MAVLVFLHGSNSSPEDCHDVSAAAQENGVHCVLPRGRLSDEGSWSWFGSSDRGVDEASIQESITQVVAVVHACRQDAGVPSEPIMLAGFSQGAAMALSACAVLGDEVDGLVMMSGFVPESTRWAPDLTKLSGMNVKILHGMADEIVDPLIAQDLADTLQRVGAAVTTHVGHYGHVRNPESIAVLMDVMVNCQRGGDTTPQR